MLLSWDFNLKVFPLRGPEMPKRPGSVLGMYLLFWGAIFLVLVPAPANFVKRRTAPTMCQEWPQTPFAKYGRRSSKHVSSSMKNSGGVSGDGGGLGRAGELRVRSLAPPFAKHGRKLEHAASCTLLTDFLSGLFALKYGYFSFCAGSNNFQVLSCVRDFSNVKAEMVV